MNKLFYPKLAGQNIIKNGKFYFPYLLTVVISAAAFYIMTALSYYNDLPGNQRYDYLMMFMTLGSVVLALFIVIFLSYTNSFLMKRRSKELGLYNILGMGKSSIGIVLCWESLYTWLCGIVIGIPLGMLLQKLVMMLVGRIMRFDTMFEFYISGKAIGLTAAAFAGVIAVSLLNNLRLSVACTFSARSSCCTVRTRGSASRRRNGCSRCWASAPSARAITSP